MKEKKIAQNINCIKVCVCSKGKLKLKMWSMIKCHRRNEDEKQYKQWNLIWQVNLVDEWKLRWMKRASERSVSLISFLVSSYLMKSPIIYYRINHCTGSLHGMWNINWMPEFGMCNHQKCYTAILFFVFVWSVWHSEFFFHWSNWPDSIENCCYFFFTYL